jgi:uncharacterized protein YbgA (DUF1722 family)/uncharacterized protein YbbK (DUF523 family)
MKTEKPRVSISACLLGQAVRYDGGHKRNRFLTQVLGRFVEWVPVCPELEVGMGVPRESVRLVGRAQEPRMIAERSQTDWTEKMQAYARRRIEKLEKMRLDGYVLKKDSPSCGMERVRVYAMRGAPTREGRGMFARALTDAMPLLPMEEEGRLADLKLMENFIERIFAYHRWQQLLEGRASARRLVEFHTRHKLLLLAHSESHFRRLGRLVAQAGKQPLAPILQEYGTALMQALSVPATARKHVNVLEHMMGYFSPQIESAERGELGEIIREYRRGLLPLVVPITLIRHYLKKFHVDYLLNQVYLDADPRELMLRNHV